MADLIQIDTDEEMDKYAEAELISSNPPPVAAIKQKTVNYNPTTGRNDVLTPLSTGGYVKVGDEELPRTEKVQQYARELENIGVPFDMADYEAAGFSTEEVQAAGVMPVEQEKTGRTEPLREGEQLRILREGGDAAIAAPSRMFMRDDWNRGTVDVLSAIGVPEQQANQIADVVMGQVDTSGGTGIFDTGIGIIDFTPIGLAFGIEEIGDQLNRSIQEDDKLGIGAGMLFLALSAAEAYPLTKAGAKAVKAQIPAIRQAITDLGQGAEARIAERGDTTLFSNPVEPVVDQALAMAGRAAGEAQSLPDMLEQKYPNVTLDISGDAEKGYELSRLVIPEGERGEGIGTEVMQDMIDMADEQGARISLTPDVSFGGTSVARLKKFYKQFGFVENKGKNKDFSIRNTMYRDPQLTGGAD